MGLGGGELAGVRIDLEKGGERRYNKGSFPGSSMVEQEAVNFEVAGSSPAPGAKLKDERRRVSAVFCGFVCFCVFWLRWVRSV